MDEEKLNYAEVYGKEYKEILRYIRRMRGSDWAEAEDLTQQVFVIALQKWDAVQDSENSTGYLVNIAKNLLKKYARDQMAACMNQPELLETVFSDHRQEQALEMTEYYVSMKSVVPDEQVDALRLYYEDGYTAEEIARDLGIQKSCFKRRIERIKEKLRKEIR